MISDDFKGDWYGAATNQCGHMTLGLGFAVYLPLAGWWSVPLAALAYWVIVEVGMQRNSLWRDSIMDTAHVMAGAAFGSYVMQYIPPNDYTPQVIYALWAALLGFESWSKR